MELLKLRVMKKVSLITTILAIVGLSIGFACASVINVSGIVSDYSGKPLSGVEVSIKGKNESTVTSKNGKYSIKAKRGETLQFRLEGYGTVSLKVTGESMDVAMPFGAQEISQEGVDIASEREPFVKVNHRTAAKSSQYSLAICPTAPIMPLPGYQGNSEEYSSFKENRFISVFKEPLSTFGLDANGASYSNVRRLINEGKLPPSDAVRVEEFVNYFSYDYPTPRGKEPLSITTEVGSCPWNSQHKLVRIGVKAKEVDTRNIPPANFVFLIDVSGSMYNDLPLVKSSLKLLVNNLRKEDRVAIVTYAGSASETLGSTPGDDKQAIRDVIDKLVASGSTAGGEGIQLAYRTAKQNFVEGGNNRIILCTDGDFNVGVSSVDELENLIEKERRSGVFLSVLGYGYGNYKDDKMQTLAEKGNGNYAYIDNLQEANRVLVSEFGSTMYAVAKDVKLQVEFNPSKVQAYRLLGYESRLLEAEDFNDDTKDAGELGAGHTVTAFYEVVPTGVESNVFGTVDPLKYQPNREERAVDNKNSKELMTVKLRWKEPTEDSSQKMEVAVIEGSKTAPSEDYYFAASVALFAQLLKESEFVEGATLDHVVKLANKNIGKDLHGYRREFVRVVESSKGLTK